MASIACDGFSSHSFAQLQDSLATQFLKLGFALQAPDFNHSDAVEHHEAFSAFLANLLVDAFARDSAEPCRVWAEANFPDLSIEIALKDERAFDLNEPITRMTLAGCVHSIENILTDTTFESCAPVQHWQPRLGLVERSCRRCRCNQPAKWIWRAQHAHAGQRPVTTHTACVRPWPAGNVAAIRRLRSARRRLARHAPGIGAQPSGRRRLRPILSRVKFDAGARIRRRAPANPHASATRRLRNRRSHAAPPPAPHGAANVRPPGAC
jgi:hypothetical protein